MLAQGDFDFHARIGIVTEHFGNTPDRLRMLVRLFDDFDHHHLPGLDLALLVGRHKNILVDAPVFRHHHHDAVFDQDATDDHTVGALKHFDDRPFAPPLAVQPDHPSQRAIAMQHLGHLLGIEKQIIAAVIGNEEAITVGMPFNTPGNQAGALGNDVRPFAVAHQLRLALHRPKAALEHVEFVIPDIKQHTKLFATDRLALFLKYLQDVLP